MSPCLLPLMLIVPFPQEPGIAPEIVVTPTRGPALAQESARHVTVVTAEEIASKGYRSVPDALRGEAGVLVQQTNLGGGSPFIRGLTGNQILLMVDGVRLNNAGTRFGPNQMLNTVDLSSVERIEIVRGAGSVLYGSDAIGGVVNVITKRWGPGTADPGVRGALRLGAATGTHGRWGSLEGSATGANSGFGWIHTQRVFGDVHAGGSIGSSTQGNTGYDQDDWFGAFTQRLESGRTFDLSIQRTTANDVPRTDKLNLNGEVTNHFTLQQREMIHARVTDPAGAGAWADGWAFSIAWQDHEEERDRLTDLSSSLTEERDQITTLNTSFTLHKDLSGGSSSFHQLTYGLDVDLERVESRRLSAGVPDLIARFPDNAHVLRAGLFMQDERDLGSGVSMLAGLRPQVSVHDASLFDPDFFGPGVPLDADLDEAYTGLAGGVSFSWAAADDLDVILGAHRSFRAPNFEDAGSADESFGGLGDFEVPNPDVTPEYGNELELGVRWAGPRGITASLFGFRTGIEDAIGRALDPASNMDIDGDTLEDLAVTKKNVGDARIHGMEGSVEMPISRDWDLGLTGAWTVGRQWSDTEPDLNDVPFRRIPPLRGLASLRRTFSDSLWGALEWEVAAKQDRLHPGDISDVRIPDGGTPGYGVVHLRSGGHWRMRTRWTLGVENIGDKRYRIHGSGFDMPGISLVAGLEIRF